MKIPENELKEFEKVLKKADWYFQYADDGRAYREGRASVDSAVSMRFVLCKKYPESEKDIDELFAKYRPSRK